MNYSVWLFGLGVLFVALERFWPRRPGQPLLRAGLLSDIGYIIFNSKYAGMVIGYFTAQYLAGPASALALGWMREVSGPVQFVLLLLIFDFLKWCVHNLLHRVPMLWEFHKVHHSIKDMDWIGDWRFHWMESIVYGLLLYIPGLLLGFRGDISFWVGIVDTLVGHFAHANLSWNIGPLRYLINSPEMHIWHHNHPDSGPINRNFGLTLAIWDWIFGTAYLPDHDPARLGFTGVERYPEQLPAQWLAPFAGLLGIRR